MSLILDALNKADNERKRKQEDLPGIATHHESFVPYQGKSKFKKAWLFAGVAVFIVLLTLVYLLGRTTSTAEVPSPGVASKLSKSDAEKSLSTLQSNKSSTTENKSPPSAKKNTNQENKAALVALRNKSANSNVTPAEQKAKQLIAAQYAKAPSKTKSPQANAGENKIGNLYESVESIAAESTAAPKTRNASTANNAPKAASKNTLDSYSDIGTVRELSYSAQQKIPTLLYTKHDYTGNSASTITMNGKKVKRGGAVAPGIKVDTILSDGVIIKFQNQKFKMPAYSSWVNM